VRWSCALFLGITLLAWVAGEFSPGDLLSERRLANCQRFLEELRPYPLQGKPFDLGVAIAWVGERLGERGWEAARTTLAISVAAIALAALLALAAAIPASRNLAHPDPFLPPLEGVRRWPWRMLVTGTRAGLILLRSLPEYVWAFFLLALLGPSPWPVVLALAFHNGGILGKLTAETLENVDPAAPAALRQVGAGRRQIAALALFPAILPRFLLYFFYRWESCVREATVLGMLGIASLGFWIVDARARNHYDEMVFFVLLGAALVFLGDLLSAVAREAVRRAR
jgi:phosphonate transport system permease protein